MGLFGLFKRHKEEQINNEIINSTTVKFSNDSVNIPQENEYLQDNPTLEDGLAYGDVLMLNWLNGQKTNKKVPGYFIESFQINPLSSKKTYIEKGLLVPGNTESRLLTLRIPELKKILKENNQKVSGKKSELISRIQQNVDASNYINSLPTTYGLSDKALTLLKKYKLLIWAGNNEHILSPKDYIPFINSSKAAPEIAISLLEKHIDELIESNELFSAYPLSNTESEIATFYASLGDNTNYVKHYVYTTLIDYLCVTEIKADFYIEPQDYNTQYIQSHIIDSLQDQEINNQILSPIVIDFIKRYDRLLTVYFKNNPEIGVAAVMDALVLPPNKYHEKRQKILRKLRNSK